MLLIETAKFALLIKLVFEPKRFLSNALPPLKNRPKKGDSLMAERQSKVDTLLA